MKTLFFSLFSLALLAVSPITGQAAADKKQETMNKGSVEAAKQWLSLIDAGEYTEAWNKGSVTMKLKIPLKFWINFMNATREPLGNQTSRTLVEQRTSTNPPNLPAGNYMVLLFNAEFAGGKKARELLTQVQESDGEWKTLTYLIQRK